MEGAYDRFEYKTKIQFLFKFYFIEFSVIGSKLPHVAPFAVTVLFSVKFS